MRAAQLQNFRAQMRARAEAQQTLRTQLIASMPVAASPNMYQLCPNVACNVMVMRVSGCNHITCVCGQHYFCFECGSGFDSAQYTYSHMMEVHGRMYMDENLSDVD